MSENHALRRRATRIAALAVAASATLVAVPLAAAPAFAADPVDIQLLNINDFHGRIDANTTAFATTIEQLRAEAGEENTLFLSNGDNIGASLFASSVQQDAPTIEVLNALDLAASAVGNHEFDQGFDDLTGRVTDTSDFPHLGANVYEKGTTTPALQEYATFEVQGLTVGVIGAVTDETPTLVSPGGISTIDFGDPVEAINRVAAELSDGDEANGEADVIVAEYHSGASEGEPQESTLADEVAKGGPFATIVNDTAAEVDVIFTGHTHMQYAWDAPIPGTNGETRPILQTGSYGTHIGQVVLSVDPATSDVVAYTQENVARATSADTSLERVAAVEEIVTDALAEAAAVGNEPVGEIPGDITTAFAGGAYADGAYAGGNRDDRASESALGNFVANALRDGVSDFGGADFGVVNPGGLRSELLYAGDTSSNPANTDGVVTYAEANAVLPFVNNIWLVELTGAQVKSILEQQWQTDASGAVPDRPFLHLGLSDNVDVVYDPNARAGSRISEVSIDGTTIDPAATYTVSTFSFLAQGGDNFRAFAEGSSQDTGLIDRDLWVSYLEAYSADEVDYSERQVAVSPALPATVQPGQNLRFTAPLLGLTSLGAPQVTEVRATLGGASIGSYPATNRSAAVNLTVPASARAGQVIEFTAGGAVLGSVEVVARPTPPPTPQPGSVGVGNSVKVDPPYRYGRTGAAKPFVVFFGGNDGKRVHGITYVTIRKVGTSQLITRAWEYKGWTTRLWTPAIPSNGSWQVTVTFVPSNPVYRVAQRQWWLWVTPTGRA